MALYTRGRTQLDNRTVEKLQDLIKLNIDSFKGFNDAADRIDHTGIAGLFRDLAVERQRQAEELRQFVAVRSDEEPEDGGSTLGAMHRTWMDMRAAINGGDPYVVLIEAERGEDTIKDKYEELLDESHGEAGDPLHDTLVRHYEQVKAGHDRVRDLRDSMKDR